MPRQLEPPPPTTAKRIMVRYWQRGNATRVYHGNATRLLPDSVTIHSNNTIQIGVRIEVEFVSERGGFVAEAVVEECESVPLDLQRIKTGRMRLRLLAVDELIRENFTREQLGLDPPEGDSTPSSAFPVLQREWQPKTAGAERAADAPSAGTTPGKLAHEKASPSGTAPAAAAPARPAVPTFGVAFSRRDFLRRFEMDIRWGEMFVKTETPQPIGAEVCVRIQVEGEPPLELAANVTDRISPVSGARSVERGMKVRFADRDAILKLSALAYARR